MTKAYKKFKALLKVLQKCKDLDSKEADKIRDRMDKPWRRLTINEQKLMEKYATRIGRTL
jgi:hypothetical protein